jgi:hypothetical protein
MLTALRVRVDVPKLTMLEGLNEAVSPDGEAAVRVTVPRNPFWAVTWIVDVCEVPLSIVRVFGVAVIAKLATFTDNDTSCVSVPLVPVTSTLYVPGLMEGATWIVSVDVCPGVIDGWLRLGVKPELAVTVKSTGELNPLMAVTDTDDVLEEPAWIVRDEGVAEMLKSGPRIVTVIVV